MPWTTHGLSRTPPYRVWVDLRRRCNDARRPDFYRYGGRGIKVCERWSVFANFLADMGEKPGPEYSIERIDNDGNYEPSNCKWSTAAEQSNNRRSNQLISFRGQTKTITEFATQHGLKPGTLLGRIKSNWDVELALTKAPRNWGR